MPAAIAFFLVFSSFIVREALETLGFFAERRGRFGAAVIRGFDAPPPPLFLCFCFGQTFWPPPGVNLQIGWKPFVADCGGFFLCLKGFPGFFVNFRFPAEYPPGRGTLDFPARASFALTFSGFWTPSQVLRCMCYRDLN